jgi:nucleotide-binding universal stress UspA family protein
MPIARLAYMPLVTYPDCVADESIASAVALAVALRCDLHATTFAVDIPSVSAPIGGLFINVPEMIRTVEDNSRAHGRRLHDLVLEQAGQRINAQCGSRQAFQGEIGNVAAVEARYFDLALLPWSKEGGAMRELSQAVVFGAGRPAILAPPSAAAEPIRHVALAWDASRVAARALADAMPLLADDARLTVLTLKGEKALAGHDIAETLASSLRKRGLHAEARHVELGRRTISEALQESALEAGAGLLAMGGFGHSRVRDFILGGATKGVFTDLRLPVLLSH